MYIWVLVASNFAIKYFSCYVKYPILTDFSINLMGTNSAFFFSLENKVYKIDMFCGNKHAKAQIGKYDFFGVLNCIIVNVDKSCSLHYILFYADTSFILKEVNIYFSYKIISYWCMEFPWLPMYQQKALNHSILTWLLISEVRWTV